MRANTPTETFWEISSNPVQSFSDINVLFFFGDFNIDILKS